MAQNTNKETDVKKEAKPEVKKIEILRGRMPLPIVYMIKFKSSEDETASALAAKYRTTVGKISDVRKGANFGYVEKGYIASKEQIEKAVTYAEQLEDKSIVKGLKTLKPATDEQNTAFVAQRKAARVNAVIPPAEKSAAPKPPKKADEDLSELTE